LTPEEQIDDREKRAAPTSSSSYLLFSLIVLGLAGWLIISAYKRGQGHSTFEE
jgi:hypothetical protein